MSDRDPEIETVSAATAIERRPATALPVAREASVLASGHNIQVDAATSRVRITNAAGRVELTVRCTDRGCVLEFSEGEIQLQAASKISLQCDELKLQARTRLELETLGDMHTCVAGDSRTVIAGHAALEADDLALRAQRGDAFIYANDRVRVVGEKILLNSEHERVTTRDQFEEFWKRLGL
jgi:hypothetical protein